MALGRIASEPIHAVRVELLLYKGQTYLWTSLDNCLSPGLMGLLSISPEELIIF